MYDLYKPLRNRLRKLALMPSLLSVYAFTQHLQFGQPLPRTLMYPGFGFEKPFSVGLFDWSLELIARELILNSPQQGSRGMTTWNEYAAIGNLVNKIENDIWRQLPNGQELIAYEMIRIGHRQFPWQIRPNQRLIASYYKLYGNSRLDGLLHDVFGMSAREFYQIALAIGGMFIEQPFISENFSGSFNRFSPEALQHFVHRFSMPLGDLRQRISENEAYNINWAYTFDPLRTWPIIDIGQGRLFCPMPTLLWWRLTDGVYFDLVQNRKGFDQNFGPAFQDLAADVVRAVDTQSRIGVLTEQRYGTPQRPRDSIDLIVEDEHAAIFVECKASRLKSKAKVDLFNTEAIDGELRRLAGFLAQSYSTMVDALAGAYPHWQPKGQLVYPMLLTLDDWLPSGQLLNQRFNAAVNSAFDERALSPRLLEQYPYTLCSLLEFEIAMRAIAEVGIRTVMEQKITTERRTWAMLPFIRNQFPHVSRGVVFKREWDDLFAAIGS